MGGWGGVGGTKKVGVIWKGGINTLCKYKNNFTVLSYWWATGPLQGDSLIFTTQFLGFSDSHLINLGRMKSRVDLGATQQFWTQNHWIGNSAPELLGNCSIQYNSYCGKTATLKYLSSLIIHSWYLSIYNHVNIKIDYTFA